MAASDNHDRGHMEISEQRATYALFGDLVKWNSLFLAALLLLLVLWFCTPVGFLGGLVAAVVLTIVGWMVLKKKPGHGAAH